MNKVVLMGRLVRDPEIRYSQSAEPLAVTRYTLAVAKRFKRDGESDADFINCVAFAKPAEFASKYFKKGMMVTVSGRLQVRSWDDPNSGQKRYVTEVVLEEQEFAESKKTTEQSHNADFDSLIQTVAKSTYVNTNNTDEFKAIGELITDDEDLPF
jgi:single-strand DNA-binding protein